MKGIDQQRCHFRTHDTELSDDELLIMDALFDGGRLLRNLTQRWFGIQSNMRNHSLTNEELVATLKRWVNLGWIIYETETEWGTPGVSLTSVGGAIWEQERQPEWERYCNVRPDFEAYKSAGASENQSIHIVRSSSEATVASFLKDYPLGVSTAEINLLQNDELLEWRCFDSVFAAGLIVDEKSVFSLDHEKEVRRIEANRERDRTWWETVDQLQKFHPPEKQNCP